MIKKGFYWHVHHDKLCEWCYDYDERVAYIKKNKPKDQVETRLRLFKPVKKVSALPKEFAEALKKCAEAEKRCAEAWKKCAEAEKRCAEAWKKCAEAGDKYAEALKKSAEAEKRYAKALKKYAEALNKYAVKIDNLHKEECGCKEWDSSKEELIFGEMEK